MKLVVRIGLSLVLLAGILLMLFVVPSEAAPRCQIRDVSYAYPHQALPSEQIEADTSVSGTCVTTGYDYYLVRVDLVDGTSGAFESSNSTPIGYSAINFTVTVKNYALTPSTNESWLLQARVFVDRAGGTGGFYMHDYTTVGNLWIQIGPISVTTQTTTAQNSTSITLISSTNSSTSASESSTASSSQSASVPPDFAVSASPGSLTAPQSSNSTVTVTVQSVGGFTGPVSLSVTGEPPGLAVSFDQNIVTPAPNGEVAANLALRVDKSTPSGAYTLTIQASSGSITKSTPVMVNVSGCLIATATYGSELAPQVQFLRDFRDRQILRTFAGSSFMVAFNAWYYSFSPRVASYIATYGAAKSTMKIVLYPLLEILKAGAVVFDAFPGNSEVAAVTSGLTVALMLGAILSPLLAAASATSRRLRRAARLAEKISTFILIGSIVTATFAELARLSALMEVSSAAIVLSAMIASATVCSRLLLMLVPINYRARGPRWLTRS